MLRLGSRKLYVHIKREFCSQRGFPGRDKFLDLLSEQALLSRIKRRRHYKTTDFNHPFKPDFPLAKLDSSDILRVFILELAHLS